MRPSEPLRLRRPIPRQLYIVHLGLEISPSRPLVDSSPLNDTHTGSKPQRVSWVQQAKGAANTRRRRRTGQPKGRDFFQLHCPLDTQATPCVWRTTNHRSWAMQIFRRVPHANESWKPEGKYGPLGWTSKGVLNLHATKAPALL